MTTDKPKTKQLKPKTTSKPRPKVDVEKVIIRLMKDREETRAETIGYMMRVAAGRLSALYRYNAE